jgi:DNA replication licensing factor MCM3
MAMSSQNVPVLEDQLESDRTRQFQEFLDDRVPPENSMSNMQGVYSDAVKTMLDRKAKRLIVSLDDLRAHRRELCDGYPRSPEAN